MFASSLGSNAWRSSSFIRSFSRRWPIVSIFNCPPSFLRPVLSENPLQKISNFRWISASNRHLYRISPMVNRDSPLPGNFLFNFKPFSKIAPLPWEARPLPTSTIHGGSAVSSRGTGCYAFNRVSIPPSLENKGGCSAISFTPSPLILLNLRVIRNRFQRIVVIKKKKKIARDSLRSSSTSHFPDNQFCSDFRWNGHREAIKFTNLRSQVVGSYGLYRLLYQEVITHRIYE